jgi:hypothetical protein
MINSQLQTKSGEIIAAVSIAGKAGLTQNKVFLRLINCEIRF